MREPSCNILYIEMCGGYMGICICKNSECKNMKICALYVHTLIIKKRL